MNVRRFIAAAAAILTVLLLQATLLSSFPPPVAISLPAVLVAAVGLEVGPSAGMSVGFSAGLLADLASRHPAGVLALAWLILGVGCGLLGTRPRRRVTAIVGVAVAATVIGLITGWALTVLNAPAGSLADVFTGVAPDLLGDLVLALVVVPCTRVVAMAVAVRAVPVGSTARMAVDG